jgi:hypothetical protein
MAEEVRKKCRVSSEQWKRSEVRGQRSEAGGRCFSVSVPLSGRCFGKREEGGVIAERISR